ncbi:ddb1- and cul4-associated factor-like protein, partial [Trifolium pratense]
QLLLSSCSKDVKLWDATSILGGPTPSFEGCKAARFSNSGKSFAALSSESAGREIVLYDIQEGKLERTLSDTLATSTGRGHAYSLIHFSPDDERLLYNGVLWDPRRSEPVYRFDQFTDYGGGGFHPAGNEIALQQYDGNAIVDRLLQFLEMEKDYVTSEALLLVKDLLRKYPQWSQVCIATVGNISSNNVQEPKAKAALIWMLGGYSQDMHDAPYVLESLVENWDEEHSAE